MRIKPRYLECKTCVHFTGKPSATCLGCTAGEFYEEDVEADEPTEEDLFGMIGFCDDD
ncbi:MAG: hypothetical protein JJ979_11930 [Roseibium sp.]|nr:hypothetical protein [Roseibium sp.]